MTSDFTCERLSEDTLLLRFGNSIDAVTNARVHAAAHALRKVALPGVIDIAPAYASLLVRFDPLAREKNPDQRSLESMAVQIRSVLEAVADGRAQGVETTEPASTHPHQEHVPNASRLPLPQADSSPGGEGWGEGAATSIPTASPEPPNMDPGFRRDDERVTDKDKRTADESVATGRIVEIPVCYGGESGPDLDAVAAQTGLSPEAIISRHADAEYTVAMLGFAPGFPYLLGLDPALHIPRRATPRTRVPAGSVAIGGAQTGIYPRELPGGWNLIGRTPCVLFDPEREPPALLAPGDRVRFRPIDASEFARLAART